MESTICSLESLQSEYSRNDADLRERFEGWLARIILQPELHLRLLNTLSLLEHIGSVKIARSRSGEGITHQELQHLAEETRHAQMLKKLALRIDPDSAPDYGDAWLLCGASARSYFARLDVLVRTAVRDGVESPRQGEVAYHLVTWLVELRASWLYPLYQTLLTDAALPYSVRSIIGEEERHLEEICEGLERMKIAEMLWLRELLDGERKLFERLAGRMIESTSPVTG